MYYNINNMPSLCLNMIVKNESKIIKKLFDSVIEIIDCYCICDTGSTDNTVEYIKEYFEQKNIPGKVYYEEFKNFGYNRTYSLKKCIGMSDYILLMDADMELIIKNFNKSTLTKNNYYLLQGNDNFYYNNIRIIKNDEKGENYKYVGVTHEYLNIEKNKEIYHISKDELFINDIGNGGCKDNKYIRDIALLTQGIIDEPSNSRYYFYLANSYNDSGQYENAIKYYEIVIKMNGWAQEIWYSLYKIGLCYKKLNNIKNSIYYWIEGLEICKNRVENIYEIINYYRHQKKYEIAYYYYKIAIDVLNNNTNDKDSFLFLHNDVYTWKLDFEYYIISYYINNKNIKKLNFSLINILNNSTDNSSINITISNMKFYKNILNAEKIINFTNSLKKIFTVN